MNFLLEEPVKGNNAYSKYERILSLYRRLQAGEIIYKSKEAARYNVDSRSIQRDIEDLRNFIANETNEGQCANQIVYDRSKKGYCMEKCNLENLTENEALAVGKILLESRSMVKGELFPILDKLVNSCNKDDRKRIETILGNEKIHYIEPMHKVRVTKTISTLSRAIQEQKKVKIFYERTKDKSLVERIVKPVGIMFSELYFYLTAFIEGIDKESRYENPDDISPTIYRIDRIKKFTILKTTFSVPYRERFQDGEFRKRIQFMYGGRLERVKFEYSGTSIEAVLDRLPTAKILSEENGKYVITAEVFGKGIDMWIRSQGENVKLL